ncbi:hypothetical protein GTH53_03085 [Lactobacillus crispatus]|uniref:hypothetical protein n=1 Tax=Lactobacillus crispatus TaxID=47770 RepID=UPI00136AB635|nr:hypothetical protein [Lactobacillus crispatus]MYN48377.1 hypothetical protein [Lactobacillus crispatus]
MARQLDLFTASRKAQYEDSHQRIPRRLRTTGQGNKRIERLVNRRGMQSMRANRRALANGGKHAGVMRANFGGKTFRLVRGGQRASSGSRGG